MSPSRQASGDEPSCATFYWDGVGPFGMSEGEGGRETAAEGAPPLWSLGLYHRLTLRRSAPGAVYTVMARQTKSPGFLPTPGQLIADSDLRI
jgi:hypothetical protein